LPLSPLVAGFVAVLVGFTSSVVIVFQAAAAFGATAAETASWIWALGLGMGLTSLGLSWCYRQPVLTAWSTPGAALLASAGLGVPLAEGVGAFIVCALLMTAAGASGAFARVMNRIPMALAAARGQLDFGAVRWQLATPVFTWPRFSLAAAVGIALPLFVVTMASQNLPGVAAQRAAGYDTPVSPVVTTTGLATLLLAPFGGYALNLAAITAAICMGREAHEDARQRWKASAAAGVLYILVGLLGGAVTGLIAAFPKALVLAVAGLALLGTIGSALAAALENPRTREAALVTFVVSASGLTLWGVGAAFWGVAAGALALAVQHWRAPR